MNGRQIGILNAMLILTTCVVEEMDGTSLKLPYKRLR
jgi:hypothetical protein